MEITKAHWVANGDSVRLSMPLTKVNEEKRLVSGFASLDNPDSQSDIVSADASARAFSRFRGNIREMHQPVAVGKMVNFREESFVDPKTGSVHKGVFVTVYVSKGAQDTWEKVLDGTLTGFSIGGNVLDADTEFDKAAGKSVRIIKDYELVELSLVDNPANQLANIFSFEKNKDGSLDVSGMIANTKSEYTFYCGTDEIAKTSTEDSLDCPFCETAMKNVGWFEYSTESDRTEKMNATVHKYLSSINGEQVENPAINEGGVDVAEDTVEKDARPDETTEEVAEQGQAQNEVDSSVESEESDLEKAAEPEEEVSEAGADEDAEATEDEVSEVDDAEDDLAKMFDELSGRINESLENNRESLNKAIETVNEKVEQVVSDLDGKVKELSEKHSQLSEKFNSIKDELGKMEKSISSLQDASAVKKSGDLGGEPETVVEKNTTSTWGGHFLGVNSLRDN